MKKFIKNLINKFSEGRVKLYVEYSLYGSKKAFYSNRDSKWIDSPRDWFERLCREHEIQFKCITESKFNTSLFYNYAKFSISRKDLNYLQLIGVINHEDYNVSIVPVKKIFVFGRKRRGKVT